MQNSTATLHAQLRHSTQVLDGFINDVSVLKKESGELSKSANTLAKAYLKQSKQLNTPQGLVTASMQKINTLIACSESVHSQADNLKVCLNAVVNNSYKPDLQRAEKGKPTKYLREVEQEAGTFETHIRLAERLVATALPENQARNCHKALPRGFPQFDGVEHAYFATEGLVQNSATSPLIGGSARVDKISSAALRLRDQIEAYSVRRRVPSFGA